MPDFSYRVERIAGEGVDVWDIHTEAMKAVENDKDVIVLSVGDPDFATPQPIIDEAIKALNAGDTHYADVWGRLSLRTAIAEHMIALGGPDYEADNITVLAGTQNALFSASMCLFAEGDEVIALDPMYVTYEAVIQVSGATLVRVPCDETNGFRPVASRIEAAITERTKGIAFSNPNNPSGTVFTREELMAIAEIAERHDLWVIADEVYAELTFERPHIPFASLGEVKHRTVTVSSLSKSHAMTGWRAGWFAGPKPLALHVDNLALCMLYGLPGFIQEAATYALKHCKNDVLEMRDIYKARRDLVVASLADVEKLNVLSPQAGMFILIDTAPYGLTAAQFSRKLYDQKKVSVLDGAAFGKNSGNFVRLSFASSEEELSEACERIKAFVEELEQ